MEDGEHSVYDVHHAEELVFHLVWPAEDVGIVLRKRTHAGEAMQLSALLITVNSAKLGYAQRQVTVRTRLPRKHLAVVGAVHWLEHILFSLLRRMYGLERILAVVGVVAAGHIEVLATDMRCYHLLVAIARLYLAQHILHAEAQFCAFGQPDGQSLAHALREHEQLHFLSNLPMVAFLGLFQHYQIFVKHLFLRERDAVKTLHLLSCGVATPESTGHAGEFDSLYKPGVEQMGAFAQVGECTLGICSYRTVLKILLDMFALISLPVGGKLLQSVGLRHFLAHHRLFL